jgi:hypothetical protein
VAEVFQQIPKHEHPHVDFGASPFLDDASELQLKTFGGQCTVIMGRKPGSAALSAKNVFFFAWLRTVKAQFSL